LTEALTITPIRGLPMIQPGDDLAALIVEAIHNQGISLQDNDVLVITSKIVSKAEGKYVDLKSVTPREEAQQLAQETHKDPRIVELVLQESVMVSRKAPGVLVTQHRLGFVSANAGIDQSNISNSQEHVLLLPDDPDKSAQALRQAIKHATSVDVGIVISDSHGRPFRLGNTGVAIGLAGLPALLDLRGNTDLFGRVLQASILAYADLIASAAHLVSGEGAEGIPVVHIRGLSRMGDSRASELNRPPELDLYR